MTLVILCEITGQDDQLVHKCYDFSNPMDTKMVNMSLRKNRRVGRCYEIGVNGGVSWIRPNFPVSVKEGVVHITTEVSCYKKGSLGVLEERCGQRPFSTEIGLVRDPQGFLRNSYKVGKQHKVVVRYAPLPDVPEVFEIVEAYEFAHSDVKMSPPEEKSDEDDKENGKRKKGNDPKQGMKGGRKVLECR